MESSIVPIIAIIILALRLLFISLKLDEVKEQLKLLTDKSAPLTSTNEIKLTVDYAKTVEQAIANCKFDYCNFNITTENFLIPPEIVGTKVEVFGKLLHFKHDIASEDAISEMDKDEFRPATLMELLALIATHPELQREFPIIALGSVWRDSWDLRRAPYLAFADGARSLRLDCFDDDWLARCRFLAIRK